MRALVRHWRAVQDAVENERAAPRRLTDVQETDFLPAALEVIERPVSPTARWTARLLLALLGITLAWLIFGRVDVVATASGKLAPAQDVKLVQPAASGIVRAIMVRDGQQVRAGQPLVDLDPTVSDAEAAQARESLATARLDAARLRALLSALDGNGLRFDPPAGTSPETVRTQLALAQAQLTQIRSDAGTRQADTVAARAAESEARIEAAKLAETIPLLDEQIEANEKMLEKGYVSKLRVIEMRRQRLAAARDRDAALAAARRAQAQIIATGSTGTRASAEARSGLLADLAKAESEVRLRSEELAKARRRSGLQRLVSPVDGTVTQLAVHTIGGVVEAAKPIMIIVPSTGRLVAQVSIPNKDVGFTAVGQQVTVKVQAFPYTRYGTITGQVEQIGSDAIEDERQGLIYPARIRLLSESIERDGRRVRLTPGMAVTADIRTGTRSLANYLISPIEEVGSTAARER